jgi:hypothetical protein
MLADNKAVVTDILVGFVTSQLEARLWDRLDHTASTSPLDNSFIPTRVSLDDFNTDRASAARFQVVDFRKRRPNIVPRADAFQIPLGEVSQRAQDELSHDRPVLLDCSFPGIGEADCLVAAIAFRIAGFRDIEVLVPEGVHGR